MGLRLPQSMRQEARRRKAPRLCRRDRFAIVAVGSGQGNRLQPKPGFFQSLLAKVIGFFKPAAVDVIDHFVLFNWRNSLVFIVADMALSFFIAGYWYPYWRIADMDFWMVYNGFLLNNGLPQEYFDHPGYLTIILLTGWFKLLHGLGLLSVSSLSAIPPVADSAAFARAWMAATQAGRLLSLGIGIGFVLAFARLLLVLVRDWRIAILATFALAFSGGLQMEIRILRTELIAGGLMALATLILIIAARDNRNAWRPALIGAAALLAALAMLNKIQVIFLIAALPVIALPFGERGSAWSNDLRSWVIAIAAVICAVLTAMLSAALIHISPATLGPFHLMLAGWLCFGMIAFAVLWRVPATETVAAIAAVVIGTALGLMALAIRYHPENVAVVLNPLRQLYTFAAGATPELGQGQSYFSSQRVGFVVHAILDLAARRTFVLHSSPRPTIFLEWLVIALTFIAWRRRDYRLVLQAGVLMLTVWGVDLIGMARDLKLEYFILTDPLTVIAFAILMAKLTDLARHRFAVPIGAALIVAHVAVSQAEPVKHVFKSEGPQVLCGLYHNAQRVERFPTCPKR